MMTILPLTDEILVNLNVLSCPLLLVAIVTLAARSSLMFSFVVRF